MFLIWEENVLSDSRMFWLSPMSAKMLSKIPILLLLEAGICIPDNAIAVNNPTVFNVTVFPPVFGPVINKTEYVLPIVRLIGTATDLSINGWVAFTKLIILSELIFGQLHSDCLEYFAFAKIKSINPSRL